MDPGLRVTRTQPALEVLIGCCHRARQATNHVHGGQSLKESSVVGEVSPKRNRPCSLAASALLCLEHRHLAQFTSSFLPPIRYTLLLLLSHTASTTQTLNHPNDSEHIYIHTFKTSKRPTHFTWLLFRLPLQLLQKRRRPRWRPEPLS